MPMRWQILRSFLKKRFDTINNERLKRNLLNALPFWIGALLCGFIAVIYAQLFALAESGSVWLIAKVHYWLLLIMPACFLLAWWLVNTYAPFARGSGIPQVSAAIELATPKHHHMINALLSLRIAFIKLISSLVMAFGGGVIGREGPTIQISASVFKKIHDWLPDWYPKISRQNMIVTGAAAGLASAFNTPLGGIVFAIEELTKTHFRFFKSALLTGVIIAGLTALYFLGPYLYLGYPLLNTVSGSVFLLILLLAVAASLLASGMTSIILHLFRFKKRLKKRYQQLLYVALCGFLLALMALLLGEQMLGSGKGIMIQTLFTDQKEVPWYLPICRIFGSLVSFTSGAAGGVFAPSLSAGASIGAVISGWVHAGATETNLLVLCGMTAFLTSVTRSPFTSAILILEMTNSHTVIFYILMSALVANLVTKLFSRHAFYDTLKEQYIHEVRAEQSGTGHS